MGNSQTRLRVHRGRGEEGRENTIKRSRVGPDEAKWEDARGSVERKGEGEGGGEREAK